MRAYLLCLLLLAPLPAAVAQKKDKPKDGPKVFLAQPFGVAPGKTTKLTLRGLKLDSPFGPFEYRDSDHQATMGAYVGKIAFKDGMGTMSDFKYVDGASVLPSDDEVRKMRPAAAMN